MLNIEYLHRDRAAVEPRNSALTTWNQEPRTQEVSRTKNKSTPYFKRETYLRINSDCAELHDRLGPLSFLNILLHLSTLPYAYTTGRGLNAGHAGIPDAGVA